MLIAIIAMIGLHAGASVSGADRAVLDTLRQAVQKMDDKRASFVRFEQRIRPSGADTWRRWQHEVRPNSADYVALSFALAYYGVEYDANVDRLLRPYRVWRRDTHAWAQEYPLTDSGPKLTDLESVYVLLNLLYLKRHDLKSLGDWLDLRLDGADAEGNEETLGELWGRHESDMLRAAAGSASRVAQLAQIVCASTGPSDDRAANQKQFRALLADLEQRSHSSDALMAMGARQMIPLIRSKAP